ncbi:aminoglycoside N(3)-acetyltransferase [Micromonospora halophytica]|uniref:Aminoglycoside N(3)-acetyltransferase n=1 Tax=Micromonospora halophytica TaxID=47864 RepID=A0A1C5IBX4_9ACTN|nr:AAC(3) family N-acetyltransferase [Micromonospora halophytica]SCG55583.1 aminoglycoside 3-N-acetyltransferase [Micromonospora halophytica]
MARPVTRSQLVAGLVELGVETGDTVLVHSSLSAFGFVAGGSITVCQALAAAVGPTGTIAMPGFTPQLVHPAAWRPERLDGADPLTISQEMPAFDVAATPVAATIGAVPECFRGLPGTVRSDHPHTSFLANGALAADVTGHHPVSYRLSGAGPLGRLWDAGAKILMLGTSWNSCTALHLAEYSTAYPGRSRGRWPVPLPGPAGVSWAAADELLVWEGDFDALGDAFERARPEAVTVATVGAATCRQVGIRELVRFAEGWLAEHRDLRGGLAPPGWVNICDAADALPVPALREHPATEGEP